MSIDVKSIFFVYGNKEIIKKLPFYLDNITRPDFPDEVPEVEQSWVEIFEFLDNPDDIRSLDSTHLGFGFFPDQGGDREEMSVLGKSLIDIIGANQVLLYLSSEEEASIDLFNKKGRKRLFDYLDDEQSYVSGVNRKGADYLDDALLDDPRRNNIADYYNLLFNVINNIQE